MSDAALHFIGQSERLVKDETIRARIAQGAAGIRVYRAALVRIALLNAHDSQGCVMELVRAALDHREPLLCPHCQSIIGKAEASS